MKRSIFLIALVLLLCAGCARPIEDETRPTAAAGAETPREALEAAMEVLSGEENDLPVFQGADGSPVSVTVNTGLAGVISRQSSYEVKSVETENGTATASLEITVPDISKLVHQALQSMDGFDEEAFAAALEALLEQNTDTKTYEVTVELTEIQGCWCIVPNAELSNALTGGLLEEYAAVRQEILDALAKGGEAE